MGFVSGDLSAIPVHQLAARGLHLGPFGSGRDLIKFLGVATVGAAVAAVSSAVLWLPFLGIGALVSFVRLEGRTLDDFALGYLRFRWRTSTPPGSSGGGPSPFCPASTPSVGRSGSIRTGGIPISYLPPRELQRLFEEWRSTLAAICRPMSFRVWGESFSPLPFLPAATSDREGERQALEAYRQLVHLLLRHRSRRIVELTIGQDPVESGPQRAGLRAQVDALLSALERMGIPVENPAPATAESSGPGEASR